SFAPADHSKRVFLRHPSTSFSLLVVRGSSWRSGLKEHVVTASGSGRQRRSPGERQGGHADAVRPSTDLSAPRSAWPSERPSRTPCGTSADTDHGNHWREALTTRS